MGNLNNALHLLRAEREQTQSHVEKLDTAISVIESLRPKHLLKEETR
jgi:hypothetical protein